MRLILVGERHVVPKGSGFTPSGQEGLGRISLPRFARNDELN
jgi:hypothetical protein